MAAIELLKYQPNPSRAGWPASAPTSSALVYDNPSDNYLINIQQGALDACRRYFYSLLLQPCDYRAGAWPSRSRRRRASAPAPAWC